MDSLTGESSGAQIQTTNPGNNSLSFTTDQLRTLTSQLSHSECIIQRKSADLFNGTIQTEQGYQKVLVKRLKASFPERNTEFENEIQVLSSLTHPSLIKMIGSFSEKKERIIIYEDMPFGTLYGQLHSNKQEPLGWNSRMRIAAEVANGLRYLHEEAHPPVIRGHLNSKSIMLTEHYHAKISDFGITHPRSDVNLYGSDIYLYGVLLVELITGRKSKELRGKGKLLGGWLIQQVLKETTLTKIADHSLKGKVPVFSLKRALLVASGCLSRDINSRPDMGTVFQAMDYLSSQNIEASWPTIFDSVEGAVCIISSTSEEAEDYAENNWLIGLADIISATMSFSLGFRGECSFGITYKGQLENSSGKVVVFKRQWPPIEEPSKHFLAEARVLSQFKHDNIAKMIGYCSEGSEHIIVQDHLSRNLYAQLHSKKPGKTILDWNTRMKIAVGVARGLFYLHTRNPSVIHGSIASSNVLLELDYNPRITEFGHSVHVLPNKVVLRKTTSKYDAPEFELSFNSDVYAFGMLLLEIITGREVFDNFIQGVQTLVAQDDFDGLADRELGHLFPANIHKALVKLVALPCTGANPATRPDIAEVLASLEYLTSASYDPSVMRNKLLLSVSA